MTGRPVLADRPRENVLLPAPAIPVTTTRRPKESPGGMSPTDRKTVKPSSHTSAVCRILDGRGLMPPSGRRSYQLAGRFDRLEHPGLERIDNPVAFFVLDGADGLNRPFVEGLCVFVSGLSIFVQVCPSVDVEDLISLVGSKDVVTAISDFLGKDRRLFVEAHQDHLVST